MEKQYKKSRLGEAEERIPIPISSDTGIKSTLEDDKHAALEQIKRGGRGEVDRTKVKVEETLADLTKQELYMRGE